MKASLENENTTKGIILVVYEYLAVLKGTQNYFFAFQLTTAKNKLCKKFIQV